jgi:ADP-ribosylglycohydrolase
VSVGGLREAIDSQAAQMETLRRELLQRHGQPSATNGSLLRAAPAAADWEREGGSN